MLVSIMPSVDSASYQCYAFYFVKYMKFARTTNLLFLLKRGVLITFPLFLFLLNPFFLPLSGKNKHTHPPKCLVLWN